jgi:hypothetical protein
MVNQVHGTEQHICNPAEGDGSLTTEVKGMANIEDAPRLRELCERASKEYDHEKLLDLVRQINDLLEKEQVGSPLQEEENSQPNEEREALPLLWGVVAVNLIARSAEEWLEVYPWIVPARG